MEPWFTCIPGIKVVCPSNAYDAKGLLKAAVRDGNPVMIFEHKLLYGSKGARAESGTVDASRYIPPEDYVVPIGKAAVVKEGRDVSVFSTLLMLHKALAVAESLEQDGISVEVVDLRSLVPLDKDTILESIAKTGKAMIIEESPKTGGWGAEVVAVIAEEMMDYLMAPVKRVAAPDTPVPFAPIMESFYVPSTDLIEKEIRALIG